MLIVLEVVSALFIGLPWETLSYRNPVSSVFLQLFDKKGFLLGVPLLHRCLLLQLFVPALAILTLVFFTNTLSRLLFCWRDEIRVKSARFPNCEWCRGKVLSYCIIGGFSWACICLDYLRGKSGHAFELEEYLFEPWLKVFIVLFVSLRKLIFDIEYHLCLSYTWS